MKHRVVVTAMGLVTPLGNDVETFALALLRGQSAGAPLSLFDPATLPTRIAAQVEWNGLGAHDDRKGVFGWQAAQQAMGGFELPPKGEGGLSLGLGLDLFSMPDLLEYLDHHGIPPGREEEGFLQVACQDLPFRISRHWRLAGPPQIHVSACAASTDALGYAFWTIRRGRQAWMLAGGTDSMLNPMGLAGFCKIRATTTNNAQPQQASRPFDGRRDGFLLGEGAAVLLLEQREHALHRGARIWGEVLGFGNSFDAHGISEPHPRGDGALLAMQRALRDAQVGAEQIDYVNLHGTSTPKNDPVETLALRRLLGDGADRVMMSAGKSMFGHLISASGAVEVAAVLACAAQGMAHGTINLEQPDPRCDLDYMAQGPRALAPGSLVLKNSFAFGGQNSCLVLRTGDV